MRRLKDILFEQPNGLYYDKEDNLSVGNSPRFRGKMMDYLKDRIDASEYLGKDETSLTENLQCVLDEFQHVALFRNNIMRIGRKNAFKDYLMGLPSHIQLPFYYHDMYNLFCNIFETEEIRKVETEEISEFFYKSIEQAFNDLLHINGLPLLNDLEIKG